MKDINLQELREITVKYPEVKRICLNKAVPVYLLQMELGRYKLHLASNLIPEFQRVRTTFK